MSRPTESKEDAATDATLTHVQAIEDAAAAIRELWAGTDLADTGDYMAQRIESEARDIRNWLTRGG